ncbi:MAG: S46 family peptidase, partial [Bacteroidia bacterium]
MLKRRFWILLILLLPALSLRADQGMWPLTLISQLQDSMQARGLRLTADDIYNINKASVKDGVVRLMNKQNRMFCTGEIISTQGLFLTNHHCGYGAIQELSTPEDNILV